MITVLKRLPAALMTADDWAIILHRPPNDPKKSDAQKFREIQTMRAGDRYDADYMHAQAAFSAASQNNRMEDKRRKS